MDLNAPASSRLTHHAVLGLAVSFGLSCVFWWILGVFNLAGFLAWSTLIGLLAAAFGRWRRSLALTGIAAALLRCAHFLLMVYVL